MAASVKNQVHCFDLVPLSPRVTVCDMAKVRGSPGAGRAGRRDRDPEGPVRGGGSTGVSARKLGLCLGHG